MIIIREEIGEDKEKRGMDILTVSQKSKLEEAERISERVFRFRVSPRFTFLIPHTLSHTLKYFWDTAVW